MGLCLIAAWSLSSIWGIAQAAIGLGLVIFVHELGHFAVARMCGVKCDKFMVGFDFFGLKIAKKWGETVYGIGIFPLGGYVKMLGQDDDPSKINEQYNKSEIEAAGGQAKAITGPDGETRYVDPRSYLAKSVPQRMAIISAGVIMNMIFAFIFAFIAFNIGVPKQPCVVGSATPGGAAWKAGFRTGDQIIKLGELENPGFDDLQQKVTLGNLETGITCTVIRAETGKEEVIQLVPEKTGSLARVGLSNSVSLTIDKAVAERTKNSSAPGAKEGTFQAGDTITAINGQSVKTYQDLVAILVDQRAQPAEYTLSRPAEVEDASPETVSVTLPPNGREQLGIVPVLGPIKAIQKGSPAEGADIKVGDLLVAINGNRLGAAPNGEVSWNPMTANERLSAFARDGETITLTIQRDGSEDAIDVELTPRKVAWIDRSLGIGTPLSYESLGIAVEVQAEVAAIVAGSPAADVDLAVGDKITSAQITIGPDAKEVFKAPLPFSEEKPSWPFFTSTLQDLRDAEATLQVSRGDKTHEVKLKPTTSTDSFVYQRGIALAPLKVTRKATNLGESVSMAWDSTWGSLTMVFNFLSKIGGQVPVTALGGPITIATAAGASAYEGPGTLLLFLTMLSANLAVLNFLPIPMLDGGHMVFLAWEGITGKPANEKVVMTLHLIGTALLVSLMLFVFGLDLGFIPRNL